MGPQNSSIMKAWENINFKLPGEVVSGLMVDPKNQLVNAPNVCVSNFSSREALRAGDERITRNNEELYKNMSEHVYWLADQFRHCNINKESGYGAPRVHAVTNLGFMLGLKSKYLQDGMERVIDASEGENEDVQQDMVSVMATIFKDLPNIKSQSTKGLSDGKVGEELVSMCMPGLSDIRGLEFSDDEMDQDNDGSQSDGDINELRTAIRGRPAAIEDDSRSTQQLSSREGTGNRQEIANIPNIEGCLLYDCYLRFKSVGVDVTEIDRRILYDRRYTNYNNDGTPPEVYRTLDKCLLRILQKGDIIGYSRVVSSLRSEPIKITSTLLQDMALWKSWLINGQHLCLYGAGSKRKVMKAFTEVALRDGTVITVNAYRIKGPVAETLWSLVNREYVQRRLNTATSSDPKKELRKKIEQSRRPLYIVVLGLESLVAKGSLSGILPLTKVTNVRLIGTMSHLRSGLAASAMLQGLKNCRLVRLNTGLDYRHEVISTWEHTPPSYIMTTENQKSPSEIQAIVSALSVNHRQLFSLIARMQLDECLATKSFHGIEKYGLLRDRRAITICNNESKLDSLLTEFITHNLIEQYRGAGGRLYLRIPFRPGDLEQFLTL
ncbi:origin recognition complex subunit 2 domain containing protein [Babesia gibsoni]|uniref:Origin recognition complex subunit 2 n=1 Tax=Babesia gibsoni TaxID=33632 RepID=A0AAD8LIY8_BABGI|nr:origin recognition complex subunit 2 domain containing protein [Babesia gibsoni]